MKNAAIAALLVVSTVTGAASHAAIYRWVDKHGNVVYQDQPPPAGAAHVQVRKLDVVPDRGGRAADESRAQRAIVLYTVPHCDSCDLARNYLKRRDIPFSEVDVATDPKAQQKMRKAVGDLTVPAVTVGSKVIQGYAPSQLSSALDHAGYPKTKGSNDGTSP
ncbi:MAG: glutaredoxin domain-containing protein [Acidiferrobacterales bacterium]